MRVPELNNKKNELTAFVKTKIKKMKESKNQISFPSSPFPSKKSEEL